jgi:hypothetical protein
MVCLVGIFLFLQGYYDEYLQIRWIIDPLKRSYFELVRKLPGDVPAFDLYSRVGKVTPQRKLDRPACVLLFAIGDEFVIEFSFAQFSPFDFAVTHPIPQITLWKVRPGKVGLEVTAFWNRIREAQMYAGVLLVIGNWDLTETVPKLLQRGKATSVRAAIGRLVDVYVGLVAQIEERYPELKVFVSPLVIQESIVTEQKELFNSRLVGALAKYLLQ